MKQNLYDETSEEEFVKFVVIKKKGFRLVYLPSLLLEFSLPI